MIWCTTLTRASGQQRAFIHLDPVEGDGVHQPAEMPCLNRLGQHHQRRWDDFEGGQSHPLRYRECHVSIVLANITNEDGMHISITGFDEHLPA